MEERDMLGELSEWQMSKRDMEHLYLYERGTLEGIMFEQDVY